jgi:hypothetical protein
MVPNRRDSDLWSTPFIRFARMLAQPLYYYLRYVARRRDLASPVGRIRMLAEDTHGETEGAITCA